MWYLRALGAVISVALLREITSRGEESLVFLGERPQSFRYQDEERARTLWLNCLLYGQLARSPRHPEVYLQFLAESAYAAAWAALEFWDVGSAQKAKLEARLSQTAGFLETLKPEKTRPGIVALKQRLSRISAQGDSRTEVWAYLIGHWLQSTAGVTPLGGNDELTDLGWPLASFGLTFWSKDTPHYRKDGELRRLIQPFELSDAFGLFGPFERLTDRRSAQKVETLALASPVSTRGLKSPPVWDLEGMLGGVPGVVLTRTGHVHRQFAGADLPEWFEAVEVSYDPVETELEDILGKFWGTFMTHMDLLFYTSEEQKSRCFLAWRDFKAAQPAWAVPNELELRPCKWFEPAKTRDQKKALQALPVLKDACSKLDLDKSYLATKINAFASGAGSDEDVVLLAARYGLDDGLTLALRTIRYFS